MKKWIFLSGLIILAGCREKEQGTYFTPAKAIDCFMEIEEICNTDSGKLWGKNLYGPLMFISRPDRKIIANQPDNEGVLKIKDGIYTGTYPSEKIITTTAVTFGGTLFGMTPLPVEEDTFRIKTRAIHALFHRFQLMKGRQPENFNVLVMDEKEARLWIKLEWKALKKAIESEGDEKDIAIRDALIFRGSNRESYPRYAETQNRFEAYEGLATFTYLILTSGSPEEYRERLFEYLGRIYSFQSYSWSYGSVHGALYATLLHQKGYDFKTITADTVDLGDIVRKLYNIELPLKCRDVAGSIALHYDLESISREEEQRLAEITDRLYKQVSVFTEKPVVLLELQSPSFDFEPEDVHFLDTLGTLYNNLRISDNWGKLSVDQGGCLVSNNYKYLRITAKGFKADRNHITGEGWHIILNDGWEIMESGQNYFIRRLIP